MSGLEAAYWGGVALLLGGVMLLGWVVWQLQSRVDLLEDRLEGLLFPESTELEADEGEPDPQVQVETRAGRHRLTDREA